MSLGFVQKNTQIPRQSTKRKFDDIESLKSPRQKPEVVIPIRSTRTRLTNSKNFLRRKISPYATDVCTDESYLHQTTYDMIEFILLWGIIKTLYVTYGLNTTRDFTSYISFGIDSVAPFVFAYISGKLLCNHGSRGGFIGIAFLWGAMYNETEKLQYSMFVAIYLCPIIVLVCHFAINLYRRFINCIFMCPQLREVANILEISVFLGLILSMFLIASMTMTEVMNWIIQDAIPTLYTTFADLSIPLINVVSDSTKVLFLGKTFTSFSEKRAAQDLESGETQSPWYLILCNPGPGVGLLFVYWMTGARLQKNTCIEKLRHCALIGIPIVLFGGVHEIYYFFAITKPRLILALIAGGIVGSLTFVVSQVGLKSNPSSYSVIDIVDGAPENNEIGIILGFSFSALTTWIIGWILVKTRVSKFFDKIRNFLNEIFRSLDRCAFNC